MDQNPNPTPNILVTDPNFKYDLPKNRTPFIIATVFLIVLVSAGYIISSGKLKGLNLPNPFTSKTAVTEERPIEDLFESSETKVDYRNQLQNTIKTTFKTAAGQDIIKSVEAAEAAPNIELSYSSLVSAYSKMAATYNQNKDPNIKAAMIELKDYAKAYYLYQESDMPNPN